MSREDQFKGWAKAVWEQMQEFGRGVYVDANGFTQQMLAIEDEDVYIGILAHAGYDLALHVLDRANIEYGAPTSVDVLRDVPDMPEEQEK